MSYIVMPKPNGDGPSFLNGSWPVYDTKNTAVNAATRLAAKHDGEYMVLRVSQIVSRPSPPVAARSARQLAATVDRL